MIKVGLTGGIGSGKSTIAKVFEILGVPVYYADNAAKRLMLQDNTLQRQIQQQFGEESYRNGTLNNKYLADVIFKDAQKLALLNSLVHPATIRDSFLWMQQFEKQKNIPYVIKEAALIFESGAQQQLDYIIGVYAPASLRIQRVMLRDKISRQEVMERMDQQIQEEIKMRLCNFIIKNDEQELVVPQVLELHQKISRLHKTI